MNIAVTFGTVNHTLPARFLGTKYFGIGDASRTTVTSDAKTLDVLIGEAGLQFCTSHFLHTDPLGTPSSPSTEMGNWVWIVDECVNNHSAGFALQLMAKTAGPDGAPTKTPQATTNYPSGTNDRGPGWQKLWSDYAATRWTAAKCAYYELDNEWATRSSISPKWYADAQQSADWGTANFRNFVAQVQATTGLGSLPCFGASYADGANSSPSTTFNPQTKRYLDGTGWSSWPYGTDKNTNYGGISIHCYGNSAGGPPGMGTARTVAQVLADISTFRTQYATNVNALRSYLTSISASTAKMAQTEWWGAASLNSSQWAPADPVGLSREALGDIFGFIDHAVNQATWNVHAMALWGFGPKLTTSPTQSPESIVSVLPGSPVTLVRRPRYYVIKEMLAYFANTYPNIVVSSTDTGLALSGQNNAGTGGAVLALNLTSGTTTPTVTATGFTVTKTTKLPASLALDTDLTVSNSSTIPSLAPLEAVLIEGAVGVPPISGPTTPVVETFTGIGSGVALPTFSATNWGASSSSNLLGTGSNSAKDAVAASSENPFNKRVTAHCECFWTMTTLSSASGDYGQIELRRNANGTDLYYLEYAPSVHRLRVRQVKGGVDTNITPGTSDTSFTLVNGDKLYLRVVGVGATVTLSCYVYTSGAWQQAFGGDVTDSSASRIVAAGKIGLGAGTHGNWVIDDFGGGSLDAPTNTAAPTVSGSLPSGSTLTATTGTWDVDDVSYQYQWTRGGANIAAASSSTYVSTDADIGLTVGCTVTAATPAGGGTAQASSNTVTPTGGTTTVVPRFDSPALLVVTHILQ